MKRFAWCVFYAPRIPLHAFRNRGVVMVFGVPILAYLGLLPGCEPATRRPEETDSPDPTDTDEPADDTSPPVSDSDGDGVEDSYDCSPEDKRFYQLLSGYRDADGDGYTPDGVQVEEVCSGEELPEGYTSQRSAKADCDDSLDFSYPGARERFDTRDNDCNGEVEVDPLTDGTIYEGGVAEDHQVAFGDVNGDGQIDKIISHEYEGTYDADGIPGEGRIFIYTDSESVEPDFTIRGGGYDKLIGGRLAVGDFDQDGYDDIATPLDYQSGGVWTGGVILYYGRDDWSDIPTAVEADGLSTDEASVNWSREHGVAVITGDEENSLALDLQAYGDLDGDGYEELLLHRTNTSLADRIPQMADTESGRYEGAVYVEDIPGRAIVKNTRSGAGVLYTTSADYDEDGFTDLVVAISDEEPTARGIVTLVYGPLPYVIDTNDVNPYAGQGLAEQGLRYNIFTGENDGDQAGLVRGSGDLDGNGVDDLVVGAPNQEGSGRAYLFTDEVLAGLTSGATTILNGPARDLGAVVLKGSATDEFIPATVCARGDLNGDGTEDLLMSVNSLEGAPALMLFDGPSLASKGGQEVDVVEYNEIGSAPYMALSGFDVACDGDVDGDGASDILAASWDGSTYFFLGGAAQ